MRSSILFLIVLVVIACNKKSTPAKPTHTATTTAPAKKPAEGPVVVVNGDGKVENSTVTTSSGSKVYPVNAARSFTPNQKKNLMFRYKTIPPKILYVPDNLAKTNAKGTYYVYKSQFWYWKKKDGYFHLDENYYSFLTTPIQKTTVAALIYSDLQQSTI